MDRTRADRMHYHGEAALAATLTDVDRTEQMRELYLLYLAFQRTKTSTQIDREVRAVFVRPSISQPTLLRTK